MLKVLFINNFNMPDYLSNMLYIGLASRKDIELHTYAAPFHLIKGVGWDHNFIINSLWEGVVKTPGFTVSGKVDKGPIIDYPQGIKFKIYEKFYDKIIFSGIWRDQTFLEDVLKCYEKDNIIFIDGDDHELVIEHLVNSGRYYKRELLTNRTDVNPVSFAVPDCVLTDKIKINKTQLFGTIYPGKVETYIFKTEEEYYEDYLKSYYGVTFKKGGWDCMRHYEILANKCIPYFIGLEECPASILTNWPKKLLLYTNEYAKSQIIPHDYDAILEELFDYVKKNMTTSALASYIIQTSE